MATTTGDRILTLDTVRGVAVMGILLLNIIAFAMPSPAYFNPAAYGGDTGIDLAVYLANFILFDGKMRGLFSFLFGASLLLVIDRAEAKGENPARVHYARMVWLLVFGLLHCWLIWWGDILNHYAMVGMVAFLFRKARVKTLVTVGVILLVVHLGIAALIPFTAAVAEAMPAEPGMAEAAQALERGFGKPSATWLAEQVAIYRGSWWQIAVHRFAEARFLPFAGLFQFGSETLAYMLFGMVGLKSGMLTGSWDRRRYRKWLLIGFGIGIPAYALLAAFMLAKDFSLVAVTTGVWFATVPFRPLMITGWASLIILLMRPGGALTARIAAAGRMAFTNYLATSLICTTLFYGYGLGWFGELSRAEVYLVVFAVWALMLIWSKPWLERFAYGPLEWLWRSLARGKLQPMAGGALTRSVANATQ
ncbi:DUF418 domain-containing protein [Sphingomonas sp. BT-65]|uniref:DUF418 domain-containing protein n=1 Tax=Sphingomonas sp. BT-65 TaxID=2989821 RepID=UPI00223599A4|nr:DUF418 domain-containing protein [Sphingomonas sp. BT-65]MCW4460646.1 DUF418 domain-containing protein [Sphingomonas sp. BT-65]